MWNGNRWIRMVAMSCALYFCAACFIQDAQAAGATSFNSLWGIAVDGVGNLYVTDGNAIRKITPAGSVTNFAGNPTMQGYVDGKRGSARFAGPGGIAAEGHDNLYVIDGIESHYVRKISSEGVVSTVAGRVGTRGSKDGTDGHASFALLGGIAADRSGTIYVTDRGTVRKITPDGSVTTLAGDPDEYGFKDGTGRNARFGSMIMMGIAIDRNGNIFVADIANEAIRKIAPDGKVTTLVRHTRAYQEGEEADTYYVGVAVDRDGNVFVSDQRAEAIVKISPAGGEVVFAGASRPGYVDGKGTKAAFDNPAGLAIDRSDNIYVVDADNKAIRMITPQGVVTTIAGTPGPMGYHD